MANRKAAYKEQYTTQQILNRSFDDTYEVVAVEILAEYSGATSRLQADASGNLKVNVAAGTVVVDLDNADDDVLIYGYDGTNNQKVKTDASGELQVDVLSSALPSGAATSAKQDTIIGHLDGVEGLLTTIDADTGNISTKIDTLAAAIFTEDDAHITGDEGIQLLAVRTDTPANRSGADGDYEPLQVSAGRLWVDASGKTLTVDGSGVTQPISHAALTELAAAIDTEVQVDIVGSLPAGTNNIGDVDVASIAAGTNAIGRVGHDITGIGHGVKTVTNAGTDEALAGSTTCKRVVIQAQTDNTGYIAVGATGVDATVATGNGALLTPGASIEIDIDNLADIFIDATVSGEGVRYSYFT